MSWHIDDLTLTRYVAGDATPTAAASAEAHLTTCADCRSRLTAQVDTGRLDTIWRGVDDRVHVATMPRVQRTLVRLGVGEESARLLAATPSLTVAWLASVAGALLFAAVAADATPRGVAVYLTLAPMLPVAGVAAAYGRHADPAYELAVASPYSMLRLLLLRAVAVVGSSIVLAALGALLLADNGWEAAGWLLPALALSAVSLALSARFTPVWVAALVLTSWVAVVFFTSRAAHDRLAAFGTVGQAGALAVLLVAAAVLVRQRESFAFDQRRSA